MRDFIERFQIPIGVTLIAAILIGAGMLWRKDTQFKKADIVSEDTKKMDELESENMKLKAELNNPKTVVTEAKVQNQEGKVNINTADEKGLDSLPGIGAAYAQRIIDYRNQNGGFKSLEDLKKIKGIGDKTFEKLKDQITL